MFRATPRWFSWIVLGFVVIEPPSRTGAAEYVDASFGQTTVSVIRYYDNPSEGPGMYEVRRESSTATAYPWADRRSFAEGAFLLPDEENGDSGAASATSGGSYRLSSPSSGIAEIVTVVSATGYYRETPPGELHVAEAGAAASGGVIRIQFNVAPGEGPYFFQGKSASAGANSSRLALERNGIDVGQGQLMSSGSYMLTIEGGGSSVFSNNGTRTNRSQSAATWTFDGLFTGQTPQRYADGITGQDKPSTNPDDEPPPAADPDNIAGVRLRAATFENLGVTDKFYAGFSTKVDVGPAAGARVTGYAFTSEFSPLTSLVMPELPVGAEHLTITFDEQTIPVVAGQEIDFWPAAINEFTIAGFDHVAAGGATPDLVMGLQFAEEGLASLVGEGTLFIPPGDYSENSFVDGADFLTWQRELGTFADVHADGTGDGAVDGGDLAFWQERFGDPVGGNLTGSSVPEPAGAALLAIGAIALLLRTPRWAQ